LKELDYNDNTEIEFFVRQGTKKAYKLNTKNHHEVMTKNTINVYFDLPSDIEKQVRTILLQEAEEDLERMIGDLDGIL
jgi:hypothetical protein